MIGDSVSPSLIEGIRHLLGLLKFRDRGQAIGEAFAGFPGDAERTFRQMLPHASHAVIVSSFKETVGWRAVDLVAGFLAPFFLGSLFFFAMSRTLPS
jgi:hypothetical protein